MLDALTFLGELPLTVESAPDFSDDPIVFESIEGRTYGGAPKAGLSLVVGDDGRIRTVHLHAAGHEGYASYVGVMPCGLRFEMSRADVRSILGSPTAFGEPRPIEHYGEGPAWDRFSMGTAQIHVEYRGDQRAIRLVTLMLPSVASGEVDATTWPAGL